LRTHPTIAQGLKGERLVCKLTKGLATAYADSFDVLTGSEIKVEVKFSKVNIPYQNANTKRWNWSKPLGHKDKGKEYDFLLLIGEKDPRFEDQYLDESPYVFFLIPRGGIDHILTSGSTVGANVQLNTNLERAGSAASLAIKRHMARASLIEELVNGARRA